MISVKRDQNQQLLTILKQRGPSAFQAFIDALKNRNQGFLVEMLLAKKARFLQEPTVDAL